jgi:hypothetical protein
VLNNFPALREEIDNILDGLCKGDRPYCVDVLRKIVAGRTRARTFICPYLAQIYLTIFVSLMQTGNGYERIGRECCQSML